jgi:hypothetical protein
MNSGGVKRPMSESEREFLKDILRGTKSGVSRWFRGLQNAIITWAILMVLFTVAWVFVTWAARAILRVQIGFDRPIGLWALALGALASATYSIVSSVRWVRAWDDIRPKIRADLEEGHVIEESYQFTAAKRFQEPEHGGLFYFLRAADDKVMVVFDSESQGLGAQGEDPLTSKFQPRSELVIIRAPRTEYALSSQFSGAVLDAGDPHELSLPPKLWPESETLCKFRWDELEDRLAGKRKRKSASR